MLEQLFGIQYTGHLVVGSKSVVYGYYLDGKGSASVHEIVPTGSQVPLGTCPVSFPHANSVSAFVKEVM